MHSKKARRVPALLLVIGLLVVGAPAAAAPDGSASGEPTTGSSLIEALTGWLASLWPVPGSSEARAPAWAATGAEVEPHNPGEAGTDDDPTAEPQLGAEIDPDG